MTQRFSAGELKNKLGRALEAALVAGKVTISRHGRDRFVLMSTEEYERMAAAARRGGYEPPPQAPELAAAHMSQSTPTPEPATS